MEPCEKERNKRVFENIPVLLLLLPTSSPPKLKIPPKFIYLFIFCSQNNPPEKTLPLLPPKEKPSSSLSPTLLFTDQQAWAPQPPSGQPSPLFLKKQKKKKMHSFSSFLRERGSTKRCASKKKKLEGKKKINLKLINCFHMLFESHLIYFNYLI